MAHYVLYEIASGDLIEISEEPFPPSKIEIGYIADYKPIEIPDQKKYWWNPDVADWRRI